MNDINQGLRVSYDKGCMRSLKELPPRVAIAFMEMASKLMSSASIPGLNIETINGAKDKKIRSVRVDRNYRAIGFQSDRDLLFVHVNEHDKAYRWAKNRAIRVDPNTRRIRILEVIEEQVTEVVENTVQPDLFKAFSDEQLFQVGVLKDELPTVRNIVNESDLETQRDHLDETSYTLLFALAAGYALDEARSLVTSEATSAPETVEKTSDDFSDFINTPESRESIFVPENETELRRSLEGGLEGWRVFLHPDQRRLAYRDYNGPAMVRGGAGTGKTVVAMHRAKYLADQIASDPELAGQKVLFTTFTRNLARDIEANLRTLCPEHLKSPNPRIEIINLDAWVSEFLKQRRYPRTIAYFDLNHPRIDDIWQSAFLDADLNTSLTDAFVKAEWRQIVQAKGIQSKRDYLTTSRAGRGTPLDRKKRSELWKVFESFRARMLEQGIAEPDDAYRDASAILSTDAERLPYYAVVVDESQDMGEQAFRLIRSIIPEDMESGDANSLFIVGDAHQRIYARKASMSSCGIEVRGRSRRLKVNYRTTNEIRNWAVSILAGVDVDDMDGGHDDLLGYTSLYHGESPELQGYNTEESELEALFGWIKSVCPNDEGLSEVGILLRTRKSTERIGKALEEKGIATFTLSGSTADDRAISGVRIATMHRAKGLEFHAVAIPFASRALLPPKAVLESAVDEADKRKRLEREKSLLHVAATRAQKHLLVSWHGKPSDLISTG